MIDFREIQQLPPFENPVTPGSGTVPTGPQYGMETAIPGQNPTGNARKLTLGMIYGMFKSAADEGFNPALLQSVSYSETDRTITVTLRSGDTYPSNPIPVAGAGNPNPGLISQADWNLLQQLDIDAGDLLTQLNAFNLRLVVLEGGGRAYYVTNAQWLGGFTGSESPSNLQILFTTISGRTQPNENDIMVHVSSGTSWVYVNSAWNYISSPGFAADGASGNLAMFDNGNLADSGIRAADIVTYAGLNATSNTDTDLQTGDKPSKPLGEVLQTIWNKIRSVVNSFIDLTEHMPDTINEFIEGNTEIFNNIITMYPITIAGTTNTDTDYATEVGFNSAGPQQMGQVIWNKIRSVVNNMEQLNLAISDIELPANPNEGTPNDILPAIGPDVLLNVLNSIYKTVQQTGNLARYLGIFALASQDGETGIDISTPTLSQNYSFIQANNIWNKIRQLGNRMVMNGPAVYNFSAQNEVASFTGRYRVYIAAWSAMEMNQSIILSVSNYVSDDVIYVCAPSRGDLNTTTPNYIRTVDSQGTRDWPVLCTGTYVFYVANNQFYKLLQTV